MSRSVLESNGSDSSGSYPMVVKHSSRSNQEGFTLRGQNLSERITKPQSRAEGANLETENIFETIIVPDEFEKRATDELKSRRPDIGASELKSMAKSDAMVDWIATSFVELFASCVVNYSLVGAYHVRMYNKAGMGFPEGYQYRLPDVKNIPSGPMYVHEVFEWVEKKLDDTSVFPEEPHVPYPHDMLTNHVPELMKRLFRVYAIIFATCGAELAAAEKKVDVQLDFAKLYFFIKEYELLEDPAKEFAALSSKAAKRSISLDELDKKFQEEKKLALA